MNDDQDSFALSVVEDSTDGTVGAGEPLFDMNLVKKRWARARHNFDQFNFLYEEIGGRMHERLVEINREFDTALMLGPIAGGIDDAAKTMSANHPFGEMLPADQDTLDLVTSNLVLHWVNDLPGMLIQINRALKPDGLFLGALLGGETLFELRDALMLAELETTKGAAPRTSPMADLRDLGGLLQRAGFALPVVDTDRFRISYANIFDLMRDLRGMAQTNALIKRTNRSLRRDTLIRAGEIYGDKYPHDDGGICATFDVIYLTGWAPHPDQPKPLKPGTAKVSLADVLNATDD